MSTSKVLRVVVAVLFLCPVGTAAADDTYEVGDRVTLRERSRGIPMHAVQGESSMFDRLDPGSEVRIIGGGEEPHRHWFKVKQGPVEGWMIASYFGGLVDDSSSPGAYDSAERCVVGTWNLEHFGVGKKRGFPENEDGIDERTDDDLEKLALAITEKIDACILMLQEIDGRSEEDAFGEVYQVSPLLDRLVVFLGEDWHYVLTEQGGSQRIAMLYDESRVRINEIWEWDMPNRRVGDWDPYDDPPRFKKKGTFDRDPLVAHVTLVTEDGAKTWNDFTIVGLHLASQQWRVKNHDTAMRLIRDELEAARARGELGGADEDDVLIMGDFNASMFDRRAEEFFWEMDWGHQGWKVMAGSNYPATRLTKWPPRLERSAIDYVIASWGREGADGLVGQELESRYAWVHLDLIEWVGGGQEYRRQLSDHLPVTVEMRVVADLD